MRMIALLGVMIPGCLAVVALGYAAAPWTICRRLEAAAVAVGKTGRAAKGDRLDRAPFASDGAAGAPGP